jgi:uncharacterized protein (DUF1501 family)
MHHHHPSSRRHFLKSMLAAPGACGLSPLMLAGQASAATASDYKALVCIFLLGGNDSYNTVLATDAPSWTAYASVRDRGGDSLALLPPGAAAEPGAAAGSPRRLGGVLPITPANAQGRSFALHPSLAAVRSLFNSDGRMAIVSNVGPLVQPLNKAMYDDAALRSARPPRLFSHNDQQSVWQAFAPEGRALGWGGRAVDSLNAGLNNPFAAVSVAGNAVWLSGDATRQTLVAPTGPVPIGITPSGQVYGSRALGQALQSIVSSNTRSHVLEQDLNSVSRRSIEVESRLREALRPASDAAWATPATSYSQANDPKLQYLSPGQGRLLANPLAAQLQMVARMIDAAPKLGTRRQVFFVGISGFDTHNGQNANHPELLAALAAAMRYFDTTLGELGQRNNVTTFTASEFGRTFTSNGDGTDHGWGGHHFVMGGAVRGGDLYGRFPTLAAKNISDNRFDGSTDLLLNGALLPQISVDQYGATMARWFGLSDAQCLDVFPNLKNFAAGSRNLGFMRT